MSGISVTPEDVAAVTGVSLDPDRFAALDGRARALLATEYAGDPEIAEGRASAVLSSVYLSVAVRLVTNPLGARSIGLGSANVTLGGSDESLSDALTLTAREAASLRGLRRSSRPTWVALRPSVSDYFDPGGAP